MNIYPDLAKVALYLTIKNEPKQAFVGTQNLPDTAVEELNEGNQYFGSHLIVVKTILGDGNLVVLHCLGQPIYPFNPFGGTVLPCLAIVLDYNNTLKMSTIPYPRIVSPECVVDGHKDYLYLYELHPTSGEKRRLINVTHELKDSSDWQRIDLSAQHYCEVLRIDDGTAAEIRFSPDVLLVERATYQLQRNRFCLTPNTQVCRPGCLATLHDHAVYMSGKAINLEALTYPGREQIPYGRIIGDVLSGALPL